MEWFTDAAAKRKFECFIAEASDALFRSGHLMTGNAADAEDLVQETFLRRRRPAHRPGHRPATTRQDVLDRGRPGAQQPTMHRPLAEYQPGGTGAGFECDDGWPRGAGVPG